MTSTSAETPRPHRQHPSTELSTGLGPAAGRLGDAREDFEQGALARAVAADHADDLAALHLKGDVLEGPEVFRGLKIGD